MVRAHAAPVPARVRVSRRAVFWIVVGLCCGIIVVAAGVILYSLFDEDLVGRYDGALAYLTIFALVFSDAIVPIFPGETTLNTAAVLASQGGLELAPVVVAGALGAILGDSALYWIARTGPRTLKARLEAASEKDERVARGLELLGRSAPILISCGRFVPGVRFAVNVSMGLTEYPYRRFLLFSALGGAFWSLYTCLLAYWLGTALADFPLASIIISGLVTTVLIVLVYWIDRRRRESSPGPSAPAAM